MGSLRKILGWLLAPEAGDPLTTVQMSPRLGRGFSADEIAAGAPVVMISEGTWVGRFGADSAVMGIRAVQDFIE